MACVRLEPALLTSQQASRPLASTTQRAVYWVSPESAFRQTVWSPPACNSTERTLTGRIAIFKHFKNAARARGSEAGNIIIITRQKKGWFWQIPINDDTTSVGHVSLSADLQKSGQRPEAWFDPIFSSGVYLGLESALAASQAIVEAGDNALFKQICRWNRNYRLVPSP